MLPDAEVTRVSTSKWVSTLADSDAETKNTTLFLKCRPDTLGAVAMVKFVEQQERKLVYDAEIAEVQNALAGELTSFRSHVLIDQWLLDYDVRAYGRVHRFKVLLLRGGSRSGKTQKAKSIFGHAHTLVVNCQGLGNAIPSLQDFDRSVHKCIVFDECQQDQVLSNKALFQVGPDKVAHIATKCGVTKQPWCAAAIVSTSPDPRDLPMSRTKIG